MTEKKDKKTLDDNKNREISFDLRALRPLDLLRFIQIATVLARYGAIEIVRKTPRLVLRPRKTSPEVLAIAVRRSFVRLGPTFVKLGQIIASSPGLFPRAFTEEFRKLLDALPPEPTFRVKTVIKKDLGSPIEELFSSFNPKAIAAASVAQVHEARLPDGTRVAVKVRRPGLRAKVERDLRLLRFAARVFERTGSLGEMANPVAIVDDFAMTLQTELDFRNETAFMKEFHQNLRSYGTNDHVTMPIPIPGMQSARLIVMTYVEGTPIDYVAEKRHGDEELLDLGMQAVRAWLEGVLRHQLFHGDVHAGNLFITPDNKVAFLDFGIMGRLPTQTRDVLSEMLPSALPKILLQNDYAMVEEIVRELGATSSETIDNEAMATEIRQMVTIHLGRPIAEISYGDVITEIIHIASTHKLILPQELILLAKQAIYFERYAKEIAPDLNILERQDLIRYLLNDLVSEDMLRQLPLMLSMIGNTAPAPV